MQRNETEAQKTTNVEGLLYWGVLEEMFLFFPTLPTLLFLKLHSLQNPPCSLLCPCNLDCFILVWSLQLNPHTWRHV
jgi:hypothetical protein